MKLEVVPCAVCGGERSVTICSAHEIAVHLEYLRRFHRRRLRPGVPRSALADRADFTQDYPTDIVACAACGLVYRNPRPTPEAIRRAYAQDDYGRARLEEMFGSQVELYRPKARFLRRWLCPGARVVEAGSFVGGFLQAGAEAGFRMQGVDPGEEVDSFCQERGLPVHRGTLAEAPVEPESVDAVAIWNTFDQMPDPDPALAAAQRMLRPGGILAIRVPNGDCFRRAAGAIQRCRGRRGLYRAAEDALLLALAWNNLLAFPYLYGYSPTTLDALLARHGLARRHVHPDTLTRLSDDQTKPWAAWEERAVKLSCRAVATIEGLMRGGAFRLAPWIDAYYLK